MDRIWDPVPELTLVGGFLPTEKSDLELLPIKNEGDREETYLGEVEYTGDEEIKLDEYSLGRWCFDAVTRRLRIARLASRRACSINKTKKPKLRYATIWTQRVQTVDIGMYHE